MQERVPLTETEVNRDLLRPVFTTPLWWWAAVSFLGLVVAAGVGAVVYMAVRGLGVTGYNRPIMWSFFLVNFVFWVGISHAGIMLSAILRLTQAEWRRPATRAAEVLTIFSLGTAAMMPLVHLGRMWRIYWVFPYDFGRGIWPDIRSPIIWDPSAIGTYLTSTILFVYVALLPDFSIMRDRATGWRHSFYGFLSMGWRGTQRQWHLQATAGILLSAIILPIFVSVHSIVSWDFGMIVAVEGWHATVFAPYFVIGAVWSGVAGVVTMMAVMRWAFKAEKYIRPEHFDGLGKLLAVVGIGWFFFTVLEIVFSLYSRESAEVAFRHLQLYEWPFNMLFILFFLTGFVFPVTLFMLRNVRRNIAAMFWISIFVNIGMWLERFMIIIPGLMRKQGLTFSWGAYSPGAVEILIVTGTFALVILGLLIFSKFFPLIPLSDAKEGEVLRDEIQVGKVKVPAIIREA
ncbi:MAG: molybdopterin oxidoreductase [Dehalococcoidia bacterium]|nr:molybdopterin oxidoreductase [Dehalococcoidia bacterium]